jgi:hypothetical protein
MDITNETYKYMKCEREGGGAVVVGARHSTNQKMSQKMSDQAGRQTLVRNEIRKHHNASGGG